MLNRNEIYRYLRIPPHAPADAELEALIDGCIEEAMAAMRPQSVYRIYPILREKDTMQIGSLTLTSQLASRALASYEHAAVFALTLGAEPDRLIRRYTALGVSRAAVMQAVLAELTEMECDNLMARITEENPDATLGRRFSPGYGDLPLEAQRILFPMLDVSRRIGITLTDSLLMIPSKSVTALVGVHLKKHEV